MPIYVMVITGWSITGHMMYTITYSVFLYPRFHVIFSEVVSLNVDFNIIVIWYGPQVSKFSKFAQKLLVIQLHQCPSLIATLFRLRKATK